jgi:capsular polysaccharide biosynthesis protein
VTGAQTLAAFRRAQVPALVAALVTLAGVVGLMMSRPPTYQVKVGLIATPVATTSATVTMDFGQVVGLGMPSLPEFVVADDVVAAIREKVPNAPSDDALRSAITVELVPASGVARISVTTDDPTTSRKVLGVVLSEIDQADLLAPVATLKTIGTSSPAATVVGRDPLLAIGLGLVAAIAVSLLTVVLVQTVRPRLLTRPDVERIVDGVFEGEAPPPVVEVHSDGRGVDLLAAYLLAQDPQVLDVKVVDTGPSLPGDFGRLLSGSLRKVRAAREAGMALAPLVDGDPFAPAPPGARGAARHRTHAATAGHEFDDVELGGSSTRLGTVLQGRPDETSPLPLGNLGALGNLGRGSTAGGTGPGDALDTHLVLTVRLRRTTPVALTTALITLRTHGTGVAGVAVS